MDYMIRATAADGAVRAFAAYTRDMTETARQAHNTSPVCTAALGRMLTGAVMMGAMMKGDKDLLTLQIRSDGPAEGITVTADSHGHAKGYVVNPEVILPPNSKGKLDVGGILGHGTLTVVRDLGLKDPYVGTVPLETGEIAEDLTYYFAVSEQVPSSVALGVLMNRNNTVRHAGGFILQLMPGVQENVIAALEERIAGIQSVTAMLDEGLSPEDILGKLLGDMDLEIGEKQEVSFYCSCSRERIARTLRSLGRDELDDMIREGHEIEVGCNFCGRRYVFDIPELEELRKAAPVRRSETKA